MSGKSGWSDGKIIVAVIEKYVIFVCKKQSREALFFPKKSVGSSLRQLIGSKKDILNLLLSRRKASSLSRTFVRVYHQRRSLCISPDRRSVYHQTIGLYIIIAKQKYTLARDDMRLSASRKSVIYTALTRGDDIPLLRNG